MARLIAGPGGVFICGQCIVLCQEILQEEHDAIQAENTVSGEALSTVLCSICSTRCSYIHHFCFNCGQKLADPT